PLPPQPILQQRSAHSRLVSQLSSILSSQRDPYRAPGACVALGCSARGIWRCQQRTLASPAGNRAGRHAPSATARTVNDRRKETQDPVFLTRASPGTRETLSGWPRSMPRRNLTPSTPRCKPASANGQPVRILMAATPRQLRETVAVFTRLLGHRIRTVASVQTALTTLERVAVDIAVLDEDVGGLTLCRRIRRRAAWQHIYVVVLALIA